MSRQPGAGRPAAFDVLIIGGGLAGVSLARALGGRDLRVAVVDAVPLSADARPSFDARAIALAYGSRRILDGLGVWPAVAPHATAIRRIHVSDRGHFGATRLSAQREGVEALGYVVEARDLGAALAEGLRGLANVELVIPARVTGLDLDGQAAQVSLEDGRTLAARLIVAADGGDSLVRERLRIPTRRWEYGQSAVITTVLPSRPHAECAYERFTETGPLALLPLSDNRCAVVWTTRNEDLDAVLGLTDQAFLAALAERFGSRLGAFLRVGRRQAYPLAQVVAREAVRERLVLIGNAAHTLHPVAGQGFNLGLRDVAALAEVLVEAAGQGEDPGALAVLSRYDAWRRTDQRHVALLTDGLVRVFANPLPPVEIARGLALAALDLLPPLRSALARQTMGLRGRLPRLARGLPL